MYTVTWNDNIWLQLRAEEQRLLQELATLQEAELATKKAIAEQRAEHERLDGEEVYRINCGKNTTAIKTQS